MSSSSHGNSRHGSDNGFLPALQRIRDDSESSSPPVSPSSSDNAAFEDVKDNQHILHSPASSSSDSDDISQPAAPGGVPSPQLPVTVIGDSRVVGFSFECGDRKASAGREPDASIPLVPVDDISGVMATDESDETRTSAFDIALADATTTTTTTAWSTAATQAVSLIWRVLYLFPIWFRWIFAFAFIVGIPCLASFVWYYSFTFTISLAETYNLYTWYVFALQYWWFIGAVWLWCSTRVLPWLMQP